MLLLVDYETQNLLQDDFVEKDDSNQCNYDNEQSNHFENGWKSWVLVLIFDSIEYKFSLSFYYKIEYQSCNSQNHGGTHPPNQRPNLPRWLFCVNIVPNYFVRLMCVTKNYFTR